MRRDMSGTAKLALAFAGLVTLLARPELAYASCAPQHYDEIVKVGLLDGTPAIVVIGTAGEPTQTPFGGRQFEVEALLRGSVPRNILPRPPIDQERIALEPGMRYLILLTPIAEGLLLSCKRPIVIDSPQIQRTVLAWAVRPVILDRTLLTLSVDATPSAGERLPSSLAVLAVLGLLAVLLSSLVIARRRSSSA